jgi:ubiquitin-protein ligase
MASLSARRLAKELLMLNKDPPPNIAAWMVDDNTHKLRARQQPQLVHSRSL